MTYVDGFLLPLPKKNLAAYRALARKAGPIFLEHGALEYHECVGEDLAIQGMLPFPGLVGAKRGETVVFSWVVYRSRAQRDRANAKIMADPRLAKMMAGKKMPFDMTRMAYGGFKSLVELPSRGGR